MDNQLVIEDNQLTVIPQGLDKVWSFKNKLEIPLHHIVGARIDQEILTMEKGFRGPGLGLPNKWSGTFTLDGEKNFWNVTRGNTPIIIQLKNEKFSRLILGVEDAKEWVRKINHVI